MRAVTRLWLLWQMGPGVGRYRSTEHESSLLAVEICRLGEADGVAALDLVRLEKAGDLYPLWYDWMLVIDLEEAEGQGAVDLFYEDLRSVGARPIMLRQATEEIAGAPWT